MQRPIVFADFPGIGNIGLLVSGGVANSGNEGVFYLEDHFTLSHDGKLLPRHFLSKYRECSNVFEAARSEYPKDMLPSDSILYAVVNGHVFEGRTKKIKIFEELGDFVGYVQTVEKKGATIISFGRNDFESLTTLVESSEGLWGISEHFHDGVLYKVHIYGIPSKPKPPKYQRRK